MYDLSQPPSDEQPHSAITEEVIAGWKQKQEALAAAPRPSPHKLQETGFGLLRSMGVLAENDL